MAQTDLHCRPFPSGADHALALMRTSIVTVFFPWMGAASPQYESIADTIVQ
ncbi:hypothetical protein AB395_00006874 (plasmid) [Sinorhizobium fredii CCBAU 45436]|nr:hypothetical protein AB395_00006874 [Sinorhizobium fredii CCBAU 45436]